jgi:hypothetical protein
MLVTLPLVVGLLAGGYPSFYFISIQTNRSIKR